MEWISHGVTGVLVGNAILPPEERPRRSAVWWAAATLAPDWLGFMVHFLGEAHRGVMHSLYALPVLAGVFALAARRFSGHAQVRLVRLWIAFTAVIAAHLVLDLLTCYRWNPAWPFVRVDWSVGILPMFDVYIFAAWLGMLAWRWRRRGLQSTALLGLALFAAMVMVRWAGKERAEGYAQRMLAVQGTTGEIQSIPDYFRPWVWYIRNPASAEGWRVLNVIDEQTLDEPAPRDPRRIGIGFGGL